MSAIVFLVTYGLLIGSHIFALRLASRKFTIGLPSALLLIYSLAKTAPYSLLSYLDPTVIDSRALLHFSQNEAWISIAIFNSTYAIFIFSFAIALKITNAIRYEKQYIMRLGARIRALHVHPIALSILIATAIALSYLKYQSLGGIEASILSDEFDRGEMTSGSGYLRTLADLTLTFASLLTLTQYIKKKSLMRLGVFLLLILVAILSLSMTGGRKALLQHVLILIAVSSALGLRLNILSLKSVILLSLAITYFLGVLFQRLPESQRDILMERNGEIAASLAITFVSNFSYNDTYYLIINHSLTEPPYIGSTFQDLLKAPLPSSMFPEKPSIDEGVYVKSIADGANIKPSAPYETFKGAGSWPPETYGNFILNFSLYSIPIAGILYAFMIFSINVLASRLDPLFGGYLVFHSALNFQISNLRIMNLLSLLVVGGIAYLLFFYIPNRALQRKSNKKSKEKGEENEYQCPSLR